MPGTPSLEVEHALRTIFKRCVVCPTDAPTCPSCPNGQICSLVPYTCSACAHMTCITNPNPAPASGPNVGAIAGGVVGGVVFMLLAVFILWRFWIKQRREQQELEAEQWEEEDEEEEEAVQHKARSRLYEMRAETGSTRTRGSLATSIMSRASNIIPIAYIPGVFNRNESGRNSMAPVPPIPARYADSTPKSPLSNENDALFFRPSSTYSSASSHRSGHRDTWKSITPSLAIRDSVASEVYRDDATADPMPATQAKRALARMVSVKSSNASTSPTMSSSDASSPQTIKFMIPSQWQSSISSSSKGRNASGGSFGRANQVTIGGKGRFPVRNASDASSARHAPAVRSPLVEISMDSDTDDDEHARARKSLLREFKESNLREPLVQTAAPASDNPFSDDAEQSAPFLMPPGAYASGSSTAVSTPELKPTKSAGGLSAVIEEATKRASRLPAHTTAAAALNREPSPFSDLHATEQDG